MRLIFKLSACALALSASASFAAYQNLTPPPGWSAGGSAAWATPSNSYAAQTANQWINNAARSSAMLNVGGKQIAIGAYTKLAPSAGRVIAGLIYASPHLRTAAGIATWLGVSKVFWDATEGVWKKNTEELISNYEYSVAGHLPSSWRSTPQGACQFALDSQYASYPNNVYQIASVTATMCHIQQLYNRKVVDDSYNTITKRDKPCPAGSTWTPAGCLVNGTPRPVSVEEFDTILNPNNQPGWPSTVPNELPLGTPLPVAPPVVNPDTGVNPFPRPLFVPTGDPVKNPRYDPSKPLDDVNQPYVQPGTRITPSPTVAEPWRVDAQPLERPVPSPVPMTEPVTDSDEAPSSDKPVEWQSCGLPGAPACKIDETGTPEAKSDTAEADAKKAIKPLEDFVANPTSALPTLPTINWAFTLPSGCAPIALPAFEPWLQQIDVCAFQPMFHDLMSFVWVMGGIFGAIGTFWRNTFSQG